jgi:Photosynthesis system II assembly factor YCF48
MNRMNKLVSGSLQRQPLGPHLDVDTLAAFAESTLGRPERQQTLAHLAECSDCREILYLAQPDSATAQDVVAYRPNRITHFALRWGAVAASLVIVAGGLFITRHELFRSEHLISEQQKSVQKPASPAYYDKLADKKAPSEFDSVRNAEAVAGPKPLSAAVTKTRPAEKHMTAKPQANMSFDESGQVRVLNERESPGAVSGPREASGMDANDVVTKADKKSKQRDDSASTSAPSAATMNAVGGYVGENKIDSKDMPSAANERVEVSAAAPIIETESEQATGTGYAKLEASRQKPSDTRAFKQNGALVKALAAPLANWGLSPNGGVQRSFDAGKTWQSVAVGDKGDIFGAVFSSGTQVWVGGTAGALYHSADSGLTWTKVIPATAGEKLQSDVRHIEFSDPQTGAVTAANGETWLTSDSGQTWRRK